MQRGIVLRGRLADSRHIVLDEPVEEMHGEVEITLRPMMEPGPPRRDIDEIIASMRGGRRTKDELDARLLDERASWNER